MLAARPDIYGFYGVLAGEPVTWEGPFEIDEADCSPLVEGDCGPEVGQGPGVAEFEGVGGVEDVDAFAVSSIQKEMRGRRIGGQFRPFENEEDFRVQGMTYICLQVTNSDIRFTFEHVSALLTGCCNTPRQMSHVSFRGQMTQPNRRLDRWIICNLNPPNTISHITRRSSGGKVCSKRHCGCWPDVWLISSPRGAGPRTLPLRRL